MEIFYSRAIDYLETLEIDPEREDETKKGWKQIKMMFTGNDRQALQTLIDKNTITPADQLTPSCPLKAKQTAIKEDEHYWHYRDEILSSVRQQPNEQIHTLNTRITMLVNNCRFQDHQTTETIKIINPTTCHKISWSQRLDWLQDPATLTYQSLLNYCKLLEQWCKQFQKAQQKGRADLTFIVAISATNSSIHQDSISTHPNQTNCYQCGYSHLKGNCPAMGQKCHNCSGIGHFSALCRTQTHRYGHQQSRNHQKRSSNHRHSSRSSSRESSTSPRIGTWSNSPVRHHTHNQNGSPHCTNRYRWSPTPYTHQISSITTAVQEPNVASSSDTDDKSTNVKTDDPPLYLEHSSPSHHSVTQKTHIQQHVMNYCYQTQNQSPVQHTN